MNTGAKSASYDYNAFGETVAIEGAVAGANVFRFASKYTDETGLLYYGYRFYDASTTRWLNRDPLGETGGVNIFVAMGNDAVGQVDPLGLQIFGPRSTPNQCCEPKVWFDQFGAIKDLSIDRYKFLGFEGVYLPREGETFWQRYRRTTTLTRSHVFNLWYDLDLRVSTSLKCKKRKADCSVEERSIEIPAVALKNLQFPIPIYQGWVNKSPIPVVQLMTNAQTAYTLSKVLSKSDEIKEGITGVLGGKEKLDEACRQLF